jgi:beta-galactosidase
MSETTNNPYVSLPAVLHGGDYNPEQWPESVWDEDIRLMGLANVNIATLPVFGWVNLQPDEETFTFEWLDTILDKMAVNGIRACLATATASVPAWVTQKHPDILTADDMGVKRRHGNRHTFCPNSENFRRLSTDLARRIAERYKDHPALLLWHVSNEYGTYCYCNLCAAAFRTWLKQRYGSLDALNAAWYTTFWGHNFTDWAQVEPPYRNGEGAIQALKLDWQRFQSDSLLNCYRAEAAILREVTPDVPITTNLMGTFFPLNYREWAKEMDIVSWDNYPGPHDPPASVAFTHTLMRGLREGQPFLLMEQSPSQQNWQPYNWLKAPGLLRLQSFQAVANGADSVMYFQWRRGRGGIEKLHGAIVEHGGDETNRVFREVAELGANLKRLGTKTIGSRVPARVAVLFDWENWWGLRFSSGPSKDLDYNRECRAVFAALFALGIPTDVLTPDADLSRHDLIIAPVLTMIREDAAQRIEARVAEGATFLTTFFSGMVDENDTVYLEGSPGPLRKVLGLRVEETDALPEGKTNGLMFTRAFGEIPEGTVHPARLLCDRVRLEGAEPIASYAEDFYAGEAAFTVNTFGEGQAYYLAARPDDTGLRHIIAGICAEKGIASPLASGAPPPDGVEVNVRVAPGGAEHLYLLNHSTWPVYVPLAEGTYTDLLTDDAISGTATLSPRGVRILERRVAGE